MLTSYNLLRSRFRFRRSHQHWFCTIVALKPEPPQPPPFTVTATATPYSLPSRRFLFLGFDSRRHLHHSHHHSFHRSVFLSSSSNAFFSIIDYFKLIRYPLFPVLGFFTRAKPAATIIEFNDKHRFLFLFLMFLFNLALCYYYIFIYNQFKALFG